MLFQFEIQGRILYASSCRDGVYPSSVSFADSSFSEELSLWEGFVSERSGPFPTVKVKALLEKKERFP